MMRFILLAIAMGLAMPGVSGADDRDKIAKLAANCDMPIGWSVFDVRYKDRYTHVACGRGDENRFAIDYSIRLSDGQVSLFKGPLRGKVSFPVYIDGPVMFWVAGDEDALYRTDLETGAEMRVAATNDPAGGLTDLNMATPGDNGFYVFRSETGGEYYARRLHIGVDGAITDLGKRTPDGPVITVPQQYDAPAVAHVTEGRHKFVKRMYAAKSGQPMFDEAFFKRYTRIQTSDVGSQFYTSRDGTRVVGGMAAGLFDKTHPDYPRYTEVVMIDKDRGVSAHRVDMVRNLGMNEVGISPDGRYFFVKVDAGFEIREFWTARRLFKYVPEHPTSGNAGDIVFVSDTQVVLIDGDDVPQFFTFSP